MPYIASDLLDPLRKVSLPSSHASDGMMQRPPDSLPSPEVVQKPRAVLTRLILAALLTSIGLLALFAWLAEEVFEGELARFDLVFRTQIHSFASPALTIWMARASFFGSVLFLSCASAALCIVFLVVRWRRAAAWLAVDMVGAAVLDVALKYAFHRPRPTAFFGVAPHSYSFPSGHALGSLCFYAVLAGLLATRLPKGAARAFVWVAAVVIVAVIGFSRIYLGVHYPTDVIAGYLAAVVWVATLLFVDRLRVRPREQRNESRSPN